MKPKPMTRPQAGTQAVALFESGRFAEADRLCCQILQAAPGDLQARHVLGMIRLRQGRPDEAVALLEVVVRAAPGALGALTSLGMAQFAVGRYDDALAAFDRALKLAPRHGPALNGRAHVLMQLGRAEEAMASLAKAIKADPKDARAHYNLATVLMSLQRADEALLHFEKVVALDPGFATAHSKRGNALRHLGRYHEALECFERTLALVPGEPEAHYNKGVTLEELGRFAEAEACYAEAVRLAPRGARYHMSLISVRPCTPGEPRVAAIERLADDMEALPSEDQILLHFALAKVYRSLGEHPRSFDHLLKGNALKRRTTDYNETAIQTGFESLREVFTPALIADKGGRGESSPLPVFIVGMLRSGSTLIEQILSSHRQVIGVGEVDDFGRAVKRLRPSPAQPFPDGVVDLSADDLRQIGGHYVESVQRRVMAAKHPMPQRIADKMLANFQHLGLIHLALPNARFIHTVRDPVDTCLSCFSILFAEGQPFTYDLAELGRYYRAYEELMAHWRRVLPEGVLLEVRYEDVVADFEGQSRRILAHCGLEWDDACLAFYETERAVRTASRTQVRQPIYASSVGRARPYQDRLGPLLEALGDRALGSPSTVT